MTGPRVVLRRVQAAAALAAAPVADRTPGSVLINLGTRTERSVRGLYPMPNFPRKASMPVHWHDTGSREPLLLLNGWTASGLAWPSLWLRKLEQRYRVIRMDNRGSGWSRHARSPFTIADLADDAQFVLRSCEVESATVLGFSMGGMIAQELAYRHPEFVSKLVLVGTRPPTPAQVPADRAALAAAMQPPAPGQSLADHLRATWGRLAAPDFAEAHPHVLDELVAQVMRRPTPHACVLAQVRAIAGWSGPRRCTRIDVPTVVVHGTRDPLMPVGNGMRLARLIPRADYVELAGVGHLVAYEAGDELLAVLDQVSGRVARPTQRAGCGW
jgi:pimeloyl-ACP methyl ester carboxylesterase